MAALDWQDDQPALLSDGRRFEIILAAECLYDAEMVVPLLRTAHRACAPGGTLYLCGLIGGQVSSLFIRHVHRFFGAREVLPAMRDGEDTPPVSRAIHRMTLPREVVLSDSPADSSHLLGGAVWPAAYVLGTYLRQEPWRSLLDGASVLELGAGGTGHPGLVAALSGRPASVTLTDKHPPLVEQLNEAIRDNHLHGRTRGVDVSDGGGDDGCAGDGEGRQGVIRGRLLPSPCDACVYSWGEEGSPLFTRADGFDLVLAADCLYSHGTAGAFCDALDQLRAGWSTMPRLLLCSEERWSLNECKEILEERGWGLTQLAEGLRASAEELAHVEKRHLEMGEGTCYVYEACRKPAGAAAR